EFNGSECDGYTVKFRFVTQIDTPDITRITDQQTTTFEDGDGKTFNFVTRSFVDSVMDKEVRGSAKTEGSETVVSLEKPEKQEFALEKTQFPTQHLLELLDNARKGETFYETTLFDGSEDADRIMTTTVIIGKGSTPAANDPERKAIKTLADDEFWPVDIA